jgi:cytosine/adenosine deaminase-related metal-dependent hydrolase
MAAARNSYLPHGLMSITKETLRPSTRNSVRRQLKHGYGDISLHAHPAVTEVAQSHGSLDEVRMKSAVFRDFVGTFNQAQSVLTLQSKLYVITTRFVTNLQLPYDRLDWREYV